LTLYKLFCVNKNEKILFSMGIANIIWYILILWSMYGCAKYQCKQVWNYSYGTKIIEFDIVNVELCDEYSKLWTMYALTLLKTFAFFMMGLWTKNILQLEFLQFLTKFRYYYNYYILILQCKFESYTTNNRIIHLSMIYGLLRNLWVQIHFYAIFQIVFHVHVVQFWITFDMHVEIHVICRK
jgi:hypothetical protein